MAIHAMQGLMGAGKSCVAVNKFMADILRDSERHIYTNLPLRYVGEPEDDPDWKPGSDDLLQIVADTTRNHAKRQAMQARIHLLRPGTKVPTDDDGNPLKYQPLDEDGNAIEGADPVELGPKHTIREFWYFTRPNSVVFLDEVRDIWPTEERSKRPPDMPSYICHHRHYKDDLYFFFQDKEDIDPFLRRKIQYLWTVRNSTKENMFGWWALRGLKWPIQFFMVRCYLGRSVVGLSEDSMKRREPQESWNFWPFARHFRTYRSFSQANTLPGKKAPSAKSKSTDYDPRLWPKVAAFVGQMHVPLAILAALVVAVLLAIKGVYKLANLDSKAVASTMIKGDGRNGLKGQGGDSTATNQNAVAVKSERSISRKHTDSTGENTNAPPAVVVEKVLLSSPRWFQTTERTYEIGDKVDGRVVKRVLLDGVEFEGGERIRFRDLFLRSQPR
jgi:hypothetical protein